MERSSEDNLKRVDNLLDNLTSRIESLSQQDGEDVNSQHLGLHLSNDGKSAGRQLVSQQSNDEPPAKPEGRQQQTDFHQTRFQSRFHRRSLSFVSSRKAKEEHPNQPIDPPSEDLSHDISCKDVPCKAHDEDALGGAHVLLEKLDCRQDAGDPEEHTLLGTT
eukprot:gene30954-38805_t